MPRAYVRAQRRSGGVGMNLVLWLPAMFLLGILVLAVLFAFIYGCERV